MKKLFIALIALVLTGCLPGSGNFVAPESCTDSSSAILEATSGDPSGASRSLLILQMAALEKLDGYDAEDAREVIEDVRSMVQASTSYVSLAAYISKKVEFANRAAGATVFILTGDMPQVAEIGGDSILSQCDIDLLNLHLDKQLQLLGFYE